MKKLIKFGSVGLAVTLITVLVLTLISAPAEVSITREGKLAIEARVALAANTPGSMMGTGEPVPMGMSEPTFCRGGVPIVSISYVDGIHVDCREPYTDIHFTQAQIKKWVKNRSIPEAEEIIGAEVREYLEIWTLLSILPEDDRARQNLPVLLDNERIEKKTGKDYLVISIAYFDIHCYNLNFGEGDFTTRFNGLDAGPIEGEWWL